LADRLTAGHHDPATGAEVVGACRLAVNEMSTNRSALSVQKLSKTFGSNRVLCDVDLEVRRGEIHALIGQNGSGKSTIIKILTGFHQPDPGSEATLGGEPVVLGAMNEEAQARVHVVHQDLALIPSLSAVENLSLTAPGGLRRLRLQEERTRARSLLESFGAHFDVDVPVERLRPFERASIAIARALGDLESVQLVILDEPTASLGAREVSRLFGVLRRLRERNIGVIYVSHVLEEISRIADRVSVLRDGRLVATHDASDLSEKRMIELMLGEGVEPPYRDVHVTEAERVCLSLDGVTATNVSDFSLRLRRGEIVGLAGLLGAGCEDVLAAVFGANRPVAGTISLDGETKALRSPADAIAAGVAMMPADRTRLGLLVEESLAENVTLPRLENLFVKGLLRRRVEYDDTVSWLRRMRVNTIDPARRVDSLSGGNQQKVMLGKWLRTAPRVLLLHEPTQAVDVGAKAAIESTILEYARQGTGVLIASTEAGDLARLCDRVIVMRSGVAVTELTGPDLTQHRVLEEIHRTGGDRVPGVARVS
jgi:ribose transport system ATP-binding protein